MRGFIVFAAGLAIAAVQFRNDIYDQDEQLLEATAEEAAFFNQAASHPLTAHLAR